MLLLNEAACVELEIEIESGPARHEPKFCPLVAFSSSFLRCRSLLLSAALSWPRVRSEPAEWATR